MLQLMLVDGKSLVSKQMVLIDHVGRPTDSLFFRLLWLLAKGQKGGRMPGNIRANTPVSLLLREKIESAHYLSFFSKILPL